MAGFRCRTDRERGRAPALRVRIHAPYAPVKDERRKASGAHRPSLTGRRDRLPRATPIRRNLHVAADERELEQHVRPAMARAGPGVDPETTIIGTIDQVADAFGQIAAAGFDTLIARHFMDDPGAVLESYARLGEVRRLVLDLT